MMRNHQAKQYVQLLHPTCSQDFALVSLDIPSRDGSCCPQPRTRACAKEQRFLRKKKAKKTSSAKAAIQAALDIMLQDAITRSSQTSSDNDNHNSNDDDHMAVSK